MRLNSTRHILHTALMWAFAALLMISCSGGSPMSPLTPSITPSPAPSVSASITAPEPGSAAWAGRYLLGFWDIRISADRSSAEVTQVRGARAHLNVLHTLEKECTDCLIINNIKIMPSGELSADLTLKHPFLGGPRFTGFDVRGILIAGSDYEFPASGRKIALGDDQLKLANADGYTSLFNPTDFPVNPGLPYMLQYTKGNYSMGAGPFDATLNPYLAYSKDKPRRMFAVGTSETRTVILALPPGELQFGYAVDASWCPVTGPITDPVNDFPPKANCIEAYEVSVTAGEITEQTGGKGPVEAWVYDHQGADTIASVTAEVPDLFPGEFALSYTGDAPDGAAIFAGWIPNTFAVGEGEYTMLIRVRDTATDPNLGPIDAWQLSSIKVSGEPPHGWARTWGGPGDDRGFGVAIDEWGNIYTTGFFQHTVDFDPGPGEDYHTATGYYDAFLSKIDPEGNFQWARTWGSLEASDTGGSDVAVDLAGGVYIAGDFTGTVDFDPGPGEDLHYSGGSNVFVSRFDTDGNFLWVRVWGGTDQDAARALTVDNFGNIFVTGYFGDTVDFDPGDGVDEHTSNSTNGNVFLSAFDSDGAFLWARTWGGEGASDNSGYGVATDGFGNVFVTGEFGGTVDFDPGPGEYIQSGKPSLSNAFLSKFDNSGNFIWARTWATTPEGAGVAYGVAVDSIGDSFITGEHGGTVDYDPGPGEDIHSANKGAVFLTSFNPDGDFRWARTWGDGLDTWGCGVAFHDSGNIYVTGIFRGSNIDFDPGPGEDFHSSTAIEDIFLSKFSDDGDFLWARTWGGTGPDYGRGVAVNSSQNAYVTGYFGDQVDFDPGPGTNMHTSNGSFDAFLSKFPPDGNW